MSGFVKSWLVGTKPLPTSSQLGCATAISYTKLREKRQGKGGKDTSDQLSCVALYSMSGLLEACGHEALAYVQPVTLRDGHLVHKAAAATARQGAKGLRRCMLEAA